MNLCLCPFAFQDVILPYCADRRHAPDTLFIVAEEDWRLYRAEAEITADQRAERMMQWRYPHTYDPVYSARELYLARCAETPLQGEEQAGKEESIDNAAWEPVGVRMYRRRHRPYAEQVQEPSEELQDIVKLCTVAHRHARGGFVWLCYECEKSKSNKQRRRAPRNGFMAVAITAECARSWLSEFNLKFKLKHWDVAVRDVLENDKEAAVRWGCSFCFPPIGNYVSHVSGCEEGLGVRDSSWKYFSCRRARAGTPTTG